MAISVRMDDLLEKELELTAKRQGVTKSQFAIDTVERALGHKDPYKLLLEVRQEAAPYVMSSDGALAVQAPAQENTDVSHKQKLRSILHSKRQAESDDWLAY